jgi:hypothetical protein
MTLGICDVLFHGSHVVSWSLASRILESISMVFLWYEFLSTQYDDYQPHRQLSPYSTLASSYVLLHSLATLSSSLPRNGYFRSSSYPTSYEKPPTQRRPGPSRRRAKSPSRKTRRTSYPHHFPERLTFVSPHSKTGFEVCKIHNVNSRLAIPGQCQPRPEATVSYSPSKPIPSLEHPSLVSQCVRMKAQKRAVW